jgi:hypothetical protein
MRKGFAHLYGKLCQKNSLRGQVKLIFNRLRNIEMWQGYVSSLTKNFGNS